jgi:hypothetical protein
MAFLDKVVVELSEACYFDSSSSAISFSKSIRKHESTSLIVLRQAGSEFASARWCARVAVEKQDRVVEVTRGEANGMRYELRKTRIGRRSLGQMFKRAAVPLRHRKEEANEIRLVLREYLEGFGG